MQLNEIAFAGFAGRDAEDKVVGGNETRLVSFSLCHTKKQKDGKEVSTWIKVKVFGTWCDTAALVKKGDNVFIRGELNVQTFKDKDGKEATSVEVIPYSLGIFQRKGEKGMVQVYPTQPKALASSPPTISSDEDIPF